MDALAPIPVARGEFPAGSCDPAASRLIPNSANGVELLWRGVAFDTADILSFDCATSGRLTAPRHGVYQVTAALEWPSVADTGSRTIAIRRESGTFVAADSRANLPGRPLQQSVSTLVGLDAGEAVTVRVFQSAPDALEIVPALRTSHVTMQFVSSR